MVTLYSFIVYFYGYTLLIYCLFLWLHFTHLLSIFMVTLYSFIVYFYGYTLLIYCLFLWLHFTYLLYIVYFLLCILYAYLLIHAMHCVTMPTLDLRRNSSCLCFRSMDFSLFLCCFILINSFISSAVR